MITGVVNVTWPADPETADRLADTLSSLIAGVAAGLVGDAVIVAPVFNETVSIIAEGSGAAFVQSEAGADPWRIGAAAARREWVLCLEAGDILRDGWVRTLDRFIGTARSDAGLGRIPRSYAGLTIRIRTRLEAVLGATQARAGDIVRRSLLLEAPRFEPRLQPRLLPTTLDRA